VGKIEVLVLRCTQEAIVHSTGLQSAFNTTPSFNEGSRRKPTVYPFGVDGECDDSDWGGGPPSSPQGGNKQGTWNMTSRDEGYYNPHPASASGTSRRDRTSHSPVDWSNDRDGDKGGPQQITINSM